MLHATEAQEELAFSCAAMSQPLIRFGSSGGWKYRRTSILSDSENRYPPILIYIVVHTCAVYQPDGSARARPSSCAIRRIALKREQERIAPSLPG